MRVSEKTVELSEEEFTVLGFKAMQELIDENPMYLLIQDEFAKYCAYMQNILFEGDKDTHKEIENLVERLNNKSETKEEN